MANKNNCIIYPVDINGVESQLFKDLTNKYGRTKGAFLHERYRQNETLPYDAKVEPSLSDFEQLDYVKSAIQNDAETYAKLGSADFREALSHLDNVANEVLSATSVEEQYNAIRYFSRVNETFNESLRGAELTKSDIAKIKLAKKKILSSLKPIKEKLRDIEKDVALNALSKFNNNERWVMSEVRSALEEIPSDVNWFSSMVRSLNATSNQVLQVLEQMTERKFSEASIRYNEKTTAIIDNYRKFLSNRGSIKSLKAAYDALLEKNAVGKTTGRFVSQYNSEYNDAFERLENLKVMDRSLYATELEAFNKRYTESGRVKQAYVSKDYVKLMQDKPAFEFYESLMDYYFEMQEKTPSNVRLGYRLPQAERYFNEDLLENGLLPTLKQTFRYANTDRDFMMERSWVQKNPRQIPVLYTQEVAPDALSYDVMNNMLGFFKSAERYVSLSEIEPAAHAIKKTVGRAKVRKVTRWGNQSVVKEVDNALDSRTYKMIDGFIEATFYGNRYKDEANANAARRIGMIKSLADKWSFGLINPVRGVTFATVNTLSEKTALAINSVGNKYFTSSDALLAEKDVDTDAPAVIQDIIKGTKKSRSFALMNHFGLSFDEKYDVNLFLKTAKLDNANALLRGAAHYTDAQVLYAVLRGTKIVAPDGNEVSLLDALDVKNGKVTQKFDFTYDRAEILTSHSNIMKEFLFRKTSTSTSELNRTALGKMIGVNRSWFIAALDNRFASKVEGKGLNTKLRPFYVQSLKQDKIGYYVGAFNLLKAIGTDLVKFRSMTEGNEWSKLSQVEKQGAIKTGVELGFMVLGMMITRAMSEALDVDLDDEEERNRLDGQLVNIFARWSNETATFVNPQTYVGGNSPLLNPFPLFNYMDRMVKFWNRDVMKVDVERDYDEIDIDVLPE